MTPLEYENVGRYFMQCKRMWLPAMQNSLTSTFIDESEKQDIYDFLMHLDKLTDGEISGPGGVE